MLYNEINTCPPLPAQSEGLIVSRQWHRHCILTPFLPFPPRKGEGSLPRAQAVDYFATQDSSPGGAQGCSHGWSIARQWAGDAQPVEMFVN
jgi:hypothetical protein